MTKLQELYDEQGQSPWLDNLTRPYLLDGTLARMVTEGIRGVTANPTIFTKAIEGSAAYDEQFGALMATGHSLIDASAASEGPPTPCSLEEEPDDGVGTVDFTCPVCDRHDTQDHASCPRDGAPLHAERISMPFLWWG